MMNAIFGGGATSKLFTKVREEMSLCYYAGSSVEKFKGVMLVSSGIETANYETAKKEILNQLEQCRAGNISDYEFDSAKRYILSELKSAADSPGRLDDFYIGNAAAGLDGTLDALAKKIEGITKQEAAAAAKRLTLDTDLFSERSRSMIRKDFPALGEHYFEEKLPNGLTVRVIPRPELCEKIRVSGDGLRLDRYALFLCGKGLCRSGGRGALSGA